MIVSWWELVVVSAVEFLVLMILLKGVRKSTMHEAF